MFPQQQSQQQWTWQNPTVAPQLPILASPVNIDAIGQTGFTGGAGILKYLLEQYTNQPVQDAPTALVGNDESEAVGGAIRGGVESELTRGFTSMIMNGAGLSL